MSEYQYYEFQTIDKPLTESECKKISQISSRAVVTLHQAKFNYSYGDFPRDPKKILGEYFDAMLYIANWGTKQLSFRLPQDLIDSKKLLPFCIPDAISISNHNKFVILEICIEEEDGFGWIDEEGTLDKLVSLRQDLIQGDYRSLYLAWLKAMQQTELDDKQIEPPVPFNLKNIDNSLKSFIKFFEVDENLIEAAASNSKEKIDLQLSDPKKWIEKLSDAERNDFLLRLLNNEPQINIKLKKHLERLFSSKLDESPEQNLRTVKSLIDHAHRIKKEKAERKHQAQMQARIKKLNALANTEQQTWEQVTEFIKSRTSKGYDSAVKLLVDLKDLAHYSKKTDRFREKIHKLHQDFRRLSSFVAKMQENKIIE